MNEGGKIDSRLSSSVPFLTSSGAAVIEKPLAAPLRSARSSRLTAKQEAPRLGAPVSRGRASVTARCKSVTRRNTVTHLEHRHGHPASSRQFIVSFDSLLQY